MASKYPFVKCLHPKNLVNPYTGEPICVPCGACEACQLQKSAKNTLKCKLESLTSRFTEFVTLTYSDEFVPRAKVIPATRDIKEYLPIFQEFDEEFVTVSRTLKSCVDYYCYLLVDDSGRFNTDGLVLGEVWMKDLDWFSLRNRVGYGDSINVLRYEDIQLFLKRLREKIFRLYGQKIRYYCVGEYGPQHLRPHWHLLLFYDCPFIAQDIRQIISSCWSYGRVDSSKSLGKCAHYTAGYVNSSAELPSFYKLSSTKPKSYHSIRLGEAFCKVVPQEVYETRDFGFVNQCVLLDNTITEFSMWRSFTARLFPRCKGYAVRSHAERLEAYRVKRYADKSFGRIQTKSIACRIVADIKHYAMHGVFRPRYYFDNDYKSLVDYFIKDNSLVLETMFGSAFDKTRLLNSIYRALLVSKFFLDIICGTYDYSECSRKLSVIEDFYKFQDMNYLRSQLEWQKNNLNDATKFNDYLFQYVEISPYYLDGDIDYDIENNLYYRTFREHNLKMYSLSNKYKKLNDKYNVRLDNFV